MSNLSQNSCCRSQKQAGKFLPFEQGIVYRGRGSLYLIPIILRTQQYATQNNMKNIKSSYNFSIYLFIFTEFSFNFISHYEQQLLL